MSMIRPLFLTSSRWISLKAWLSQEVFLYTIPTELFTRPTRKDIRVYKVEGTVTAVEMGNPRVFNMIIVGGYLKVRPIVSLDNVEKGLEKSLPVRYHNLIPLNLEAIKTGQDIVEQVV
jgi:2-oxoglutarate ferredoxin oxidoreductase subunit gamma